MLSFINVTNPNDIKKHVDQFNFKNSTWIVSDLKSKLDIQSKCLIDDGFYLDDSILRMSDFWKLWLRRLGPDLKVVSEDFIKALVQDFISSDIFQKIHHEFHIEDHQYSTVFKYIYELAPIILSPQSNTIMSDWLIEKNKDWSKWYFISRLCLNYLINEKKIIDSQWIPSFIQNYDVNLLKWNKHIYLDLGSEMTSIEMGIFKDISQKSDVTIFVPTPLWHNKYKYLLQTYDVNKGLIIANNGLLNTNTNTRVNINNASSSHSVSSYKRFATEALEIKYAVFQIRSWIDNGALMSSVGIVSPRIEDYWPILKIHLDAEGIKYNKKVVSTYLSLGCFQLLISKIKSLTSDITWQTLEQSYYSEGNQQADDAQNLKIDFEKFKAQFFELIDSEDLIRQKEIKEIFYNKINLNDKLNRIQFLIFIFKTWGSLKFNDNNEIQLIKYLEVSFKDFLANTTDISLNMSHWLSIFISGLSKKEMTIQKASADGIDIGSSQSSHLFNIKKIIWLGLDESGFKKNGHSVIPLSDIEDLKINFDFPLRYPEESHAEFNIRWLSEYNFEEQIFTCSLYSAKAEPLSASALILENCLQPDVAFELDEISTRIDQLQQLKSSSSEIPLKIQNETIKYDLKINNFKFKELSTTDFINYDHCGFKLLASKGFKLKDYPIVSLDLDPRQRGSITHALFEFLVTDKAYKNYNIKQTEDFLNKKRDEFKLYLGMDQFWNSQKKKLLDMAQKFCQFEFERLSSVPVIHLFEKDFKLKLNYLYINGRIDRIDLYNDKSAVVFDYKRSDSAVPAKSTSHGSHWIEKKEFQMLFYILALQDVLALNDVGAYYFFYKNMEIRKGILSEQATKNSEIIQSINPEKKSIVDQTYYNQFKNEFTDYILKVEERYFLGDFSAKPFNKDICKTCHWSNLCRAVHL